MELSALLASGHTPRQLIPQQLTLLALLCIRSAPQHGSLLMLPCAWSGPMSNILPGVPRGTPVDVHVHKSEASLTLLP
jgi:hypothetical protein